MLPSGIPTSYILLSYPLGPRGFLTLFHTNTYAQKLRDLLRSRTARVLVLYGDRDEFTSEASYDSWAEELVKDADGSDLLRVEKIVGGTHFWRGRAGKDMAAVVRGWIL
jgi:pimeloyl-ACP methyl ester carboxylesterase